MKNFALPVFLLAFLMLGACKNDKTASNGTATIDLEQTKELMQGRWRSTSDPKEVVVIVGDSFTTIYDGSPSGENTLEFYEKCPEGCAGGVKDISCFMVKAQLDAVCYAIVSVSATTLQYSLLGGPGNTLTYTKIED